MNWHIISVDNRESDREFFGDAIHVFKLKITKASRVEAEI
jgi:hypothetical protein